MSPFDVQGRVVIITGGSGFLGAQYARALERAGAIVANFDIETGVDVRDDESVRAAVQKVLQEHGRIDGLVTNAAANPAAGGETSDAVWAPYSEFPTHLFRDELDLNLVGSFIAARECAKPMMEAQKGSIVFVSSDLGIIGPTNALYAEGKYKDIAYGASKAGVLGLTKFFAAFLGPYNVRVNALAPGGMFRGHDEQFAKKNGALNMLGRMAREDEFNGAVQFLLSDASSYITASTIAIDGGRTAW